MNRWLYYALATGIVLAGQLHAQLRVIDSTVGGVRLEYRPQSARACSAGATFLVGVPLVGDVGIARVEAVGPNGRRLTDERVAELAALGSEGMARRQRVVELAFAATVGEEVGEAIERIVVDLDFAASGEANRPDRLRADAYAEPYYAQVVSNYEQAAAWRLPRGPRRAAKSAQEAGRWLRVVVNENGMFRITGEDLEQAGIALDEIDPQTLRLMYGGGQMLSLKTVELPSAWQEMGLVVEDGDDGRFDRSDFVLFYGESSQRWEYDAKQADYVWRENLYTNDNTYWLGFAGGVEGQRAVERSGALTRQSPERPQSYRVYLHSEDEQFILYQTYGIKSGYTWYGEDFRGNARNYRLLVRDAVETPVDVRLGFNGIGGNSSRFTVRWNGSEIGKISFESATRVQRELRSAVGPVEGFNELGLYHAGDPARFDWYEIEYSRGFSAERGRLSFFSPVVNAAAEYALKGFTEETPRVFEVGGQLVEIRDVAYNADSGELVFQDDALDVPGKYVVGGESTWLRPKRIVEDRPSSLLSTTNGADYIVVYHEDFAAAAQRLATWRGSDDRWGRPPVTQTVDIQDVYDEFSGGMLDPSALRNFLGYAEANWQRAPMYVLLMGDGSYDYKNNSKTSNGNWIPPYQDSDSTYDEWYVYLLGDDELPDMAIGRIPVQSAEEANSVVDKIIAYDREPELGLWQSRVLLVADDLVNPDHPLDSETFFLTDSEFMAQSVFPPGINIDKLYLAQFPFEGRTKPRARDEFIRRFNEGSLILTYIGHGNPDVLAHEQMFRISRDIGEVDNGKRLPFFYTAASQVGVFDDPVKTSMPEELLKMPNGGVIGMISATRVGFHLSNILLAAAFHKQMYRSEREHVPVGLALMEAKQIAREEMNVSDLVGIRNMRRYSLFGDPLQRLAQPRYAIGLEIDGPLSALGLVNVTGQVLDENGIPADNYNGYVWLQAFDSAELSVLDGLRYRQVGAYLFRGRYAVVNGRFSGQFRVPKDISYGGIDGRISAYAWSDDAPTAYGSLEDLLIEGTAPDIELDTEGPQIRIGFKGMSSFKSGDKVAGSPVLLAAISDPSGINITNETGHAIELAIDDEIFNTTDFFNVLEGDFREGIVEFALPGLELGQHEIRLKVWDSFNNSSRAEAVFELVGSKASIIQNALFHPSPLRGDSGHFTYELVEKALAARIQIFALSGRLVEEIEATGNEGYNQILWQRPANLANGTYLYRVEVDREGGGVAEHASALQIAQ